MFAIVGRKAEADEIAEPSLLGGDGLGSPRLEFTINEARLITTVERIRRPVFRSDGDCIFTGGLALSYRISR